MMMLSISMWLYKGHKLVMMGHINFEDHALIKRWQACKKMYAMGGMFKARKNKVIFKKSLCLFLEVVHIFEILEFAVTWVQKLLLKNYKE
jgi:hypothetical protein